MSKSNKTYYFFVGIGGIGMSALARYFKFLGKEVLGYDKTKTQLTKSLEKEGIPIFYTDNQKLLPKELNSNNTQVVWTPAIKQLSLLKHFKNNQFSIVKRAELLGEITKTTYSIAVAGTHGKTTTSAMIGHILQSANLPVTAFLGGISQNYNSNLIMNGADVSVAEADEFDRSFLCLQPNLAIITSTDADHLDVYGKADALQQSFQDFAALVNNQLIVKKGLDFPNAKTYAVEQKADYFASNIQIKNALYSFDLNYPNGTIKNCQTQLAGIHNVENAVAAMAIALEMEIEPETIKNSLFDFLGVKRRFNRWQIKHKIYVDDYAHHPTEIRAVSESLKALYPNQKVLCVFQPHLYSRTRDFASDFAQSLSAFQDLILLEIYPAREQAIPGITSKWLAQKINQSVEVCNLTDAIDAIKSKEFDVLVTLGAGNIDTLVEPIQNYLHEI